MEKFTQFRDKGSGIAPFLPIPTEPSGIYLPFHLFLCACRVPILFFFTLTYFCFLQWLPIGAIGKKAVLWCILGTPGIWWIDLQIDGVKKGSLAQNSQRLPKGGHIIASSNASPIDALYLAAIFDPIFTTSYPTSRSVEPISLLQAVYRAFALPQKIPPKTAKLVDLQTLLKQNPHRTIVVFPECTTSNGRGILPFSPSLLSTPPRTKVFPLSLRYTPPDITSPLPGSFFSFLWNLCSKPTHCIRIRIAEATYNTATRLNSSPSTTAPKSTGRDSSEPLSDSTTPENGITSEDSDTLEDDDDDDNDINEEKGEISTPMTKEERAFLDKVAEALARLGRVKRVGLGVQAKREFVAAWSKSKSRKSMLT